VAELTRAQLDVAAAFFALPASSGFVLVGGAALLALELIDRPTEDLDFFTDDPARIANAVEALVDVADRNGWRVETIRSTPTFHRLELNCEDETVRVDIAVDSPPRRATVKGVVGPTLDPLELAGRKLLALFDRAAPRDFADVYRLTSRFGQASVVDMATEIDPGFDDTYLAVTLDRAQQLRDNDFPIKQGEIAALRTWAAEWAQSIRNAEAER
jgi:Nucleotidyl transferase AbiEii toxin, Type IV TA system